MLLLCKKCAYPNLPTSNVCGRCGNITQTSEELAQSIQSWNSLPDQVRMEFERKYKDAQLHAKDYSVSHKTWMAKNIVLCGAALGILTFFHNGSIFIPGAIIGALIGWYLIIKKWGRYAGMLLFGSGYLISFAFHLVTGLINNPFLIPSPFPFLSLAGGQLIILCLGYGFGYKMERDSFDRGL